MLERIQARSKSLSLGVAIVTLFAIIPYVVGWCAGLCLRAIFFCLAALIEGYRAGRG